MPDKIIAGIQTNVTFADTDANLQRMLQWLADERVQEADLVVFPECMLSGYCFDDLHEALPHAQSIPGPATDVISHHCRQSGQSVAFGLLETNDSQSLFNSCVLIGPDGIIGCYRKIHLPYLGVDRFTQSGGEAYRVYPCNELNVGIHICYDGSFPESSRVMALDGADLLILPTNWPPRADTFAKYIPNARALENNVYYLSVNRVGTERGFRFIGQSRLCDTNGNTIAEAGEHEEAVVLGKIDPARARNKRLVRVPGKHVIDRWKDRHPEFYGRIMES